MLSSTARYSFSSVFFLLLLSSCSPLQLFGEKGDSFFASNVDSRTRTLINSSKIDRDAIGDSTIGNGEVASTLKESALSPCLLDRNQGVLCEGDEAKAGTAGKKLPFRMFHFDQRTGVCQPFTYQGCGGNANRFFTAEECKAKCKENRQKQSPWVLATKCNGSSYLIPDGKYHECIPENGNSDCPKLHECHHESRVCCPLREMVCTLRDDSGTFAEGVADKPRFAWSDQQNSCVRFSYYGAHGNYNNFPSFQACLAHCATPRGRGKIEAEE